MHPRTLFVACLASMACLPAAWSQDAGADFHKAYYLEVEERSLEEASELYGKVLESQAASPALKDRARKRLALCREGIRSRDLSRLMPPEVLAYVEIQAPGDHLERLLRRLGLAQEGNAAAGGAGAPAPGAPAPPQPFPAISPRLLAALRGLEGAAAAVTEVDPRRGIPHGVLVINSGRNDLLHGLVETGIAAAGAAGRLESDQPIGGHAAYRSPFGTVVVTERLIIAGNPHQLTVDAVQRLQQEDAPSLGRAGGFSELGSEREGALAFAFVDLARVLDAARPAMARGGKLPEEYRLAQVLADIESCRWAALRLGTSARGLEASARLRLAEGNHCLPYHLLRTPPVGQEALKAVPSGAAAVLALALSERQPPGAPPGEARRAAAAVLSGLDLGREIFANVGDVLLFALPGSPPAAGGGAATIPEVGLVLTVKDPARSESLWREVLGIPAAVLKAEPSSARAEEIDGREVRVFTFPESVQVYLAALPDRVILGTSRSVLSQAFRAAGGMGSVLDDRAFTGALGELNQGSSKIALLHAGRLFQAARPFLRLEGKDAEQIAALLEHSAITAVTEETPASFRASLAATLPELGEFLRRLAAVRDGRPGRPAGFEPVPRKL